MEPGRPFPDFQPTARLAALLRRLAAPLRWLRAKTSRHPPRRPPASPRRVDPDRPNILMFGRMPPAVEAQLEPAYAVHRVKHDADLEDCIREAAPAIRAIVTGNSQVIDEGLIARFPALEIVSVFGAGYDRVDVTACTTRGVVVTNTPDVLTEETADTALGLLLMTVRELSSAERWLRAGNWVKGRYPLTRGTLRNRTLGIVGLGRVGQAVARRAEAFGMPVAYHGPREKPLAGYRYYANLVDLARDVDTLVVCAPGGAQTRNIVNDDVLNALGPDGVVINVSRGSCIDEDALIAALKTGRILGAGLDVYQSEPGVRRELLSLERTVLLPHVGTASHYTRHAMGQLLVDNLTSWFQHGTALTPVRE